MNVSKIHTMPRPQTRVIKPSKFMDAVWLTACWSDSSAELYYHKESVEYSFSVKLEKALMKALIVQTFGGCLSASFINVQ